MRICLSPGSTVEKGWEVKDRNQLTISSWWRIKIKRTKSGHAGYGQLAYIQSLSPAILTLTYCPCILAVGAIKNVFQLVTFNQFIFCPIAVDVLDEDFLFFICQWLIQITTGYPLGCSTAQLPAHHFHVFHVPAVITHSAPLSIPFHFHPPFTAMGTSHQSHFGRRLCKEMRYWLEIRSGPGSTQACMQSSWNSTTVRMWRTQG